MSAAVGLISIIISRHVQVGNKAHSKRSSHGETEVDWCDIANTGGRATLAMKLTHAVESIRVV